MFQTLIVEDNDSYRDSLSALLRDHFRCMSIAEASNGAEALSTLDAFPPQLVFMDIKLPDANGLDLTRKIRDGKPLTVVVVITAHDIPEYWEAAFQAGADYFVSKGSTTGAEIISLVDSAFPRACK